MNVKLVAITQPKIEGLKSAEDIISYCARVSNPSNQMNTETAPRLVKYLIKHQHWSPFEMASATIEIVTSRAIAAQILRHRSFAFQEFSQRYADPTKDLGFESREARLQDMKNRQNSIESDDEMLAGKWQIQQDYVRHSAITAYTWAIENGIAKEQARAVLPEGLTVSRMYMNGTLRSWIHYCQLRMGPETQKEHREIAESCWNEILTIFPALSEIAVD